MNPDLSKSESVKCSKCECEYFIEAMMVRKISKFISGDSKDQVYPFPVLRCADCGHVEDQFKPNIGNVAK